MTIQFGKLPTAMAAAGHYRELDRNEWAVMGIIAAHSDGEDFTTRGLTLDHIMFETQASERTVQRVLRRLAKRNLLQVIPGGGRWRTNTYTLTTNPVILGDGVSGNGERTNPVSKGDGVHGRENPVNCDPCDEKPRQSEGETPSNRPVNPVTLGDTHSEISDIQKPTPPTPPKGGDGVLTNKLGKDRPKIEIRPEMLIDTRLCLTIFDKLVERGIAQDSDHDRVEFLAVIEHAQQHPDSKATVVVVDMLRNWPASLRSISKDERDSALQRLKQARSQGIIP